jgi:hypothetical protein
MLLHGNETVDEARFIKLAQVALLEAVIHFFEKDGRLADLAVAE